MELKEKFEDIIDTPATLDFKSSKCEQLCIKEQIDLLESLKDYSHDNSTYILEEKISELKSKLTQ